MYYERNTVAFYSDNSLSFLDYNWLNLSKLYAFLQIMPPSLSLIREKYLAPENKVFSVNH